jgi:ABC-type uncharacterized transport system involved in gliding motility auxiliary subunit
VSRKAGEIIILALIGACFVFVLADSARFFLRVDLTRNRAYTISPVSRQMLREVPEQVHVIYYLSDVLRSLTPAPGRVIELLQEYGAESRGKLTVSVVDPQREGRTDSARRFGILPQQVQVIQQNEQRTVDVFSGIVVEYLDRFTSLPAVFTPDGLEFNLGFAVRTLLAGRRIVLGVLVGRPDKSFGRDYENLRSGLSREYRLRQYAPGERVPPEVDVLLVLGGTGLGAAELAPVDRYLMDGGKVIFAVKGLRVETTRYLGAEPAGASALLDMLETYGVRVRREMVLDTAARDYRLPQQDASGHISWEDLGRYPPWVSVRAPDVSPGNPITAAFPGLDLLWPSPLDPLDVPGVRAEPLARSTQSAWLLREPFLIDPFRVSQSGSGQPGPRNQQVLALALSGSFPSSSAAAGVRTRSLPTRMVVIGDDDFASDLMQFSDSLYNVIFLENAVLWLSGNADLLSLKAKTPTDARLDRIEDPAVRGRWMLAAEVVNVFAVPLLALAYGLLRLLRRRAG